MKFLYINKYDIKNFNLPHKYKILDNNRELEYII